MAPTMRRTCCLTTTTFPSTSGIGAADTSGTLTASTSGSSRRSYSINSGATLWTSSSSMVFRLPSFHLHYNYSTLEPFKYRSTPATGVSPEHKPKATLARANGSITRSPGKRRISSEGTPEVNGVQEAGYVARGDTDVHRTLFRLWRSPRLLRVNSVNTQKPTADIGTMIGRTLADTLPKRGHSVLSAGCRDTSQPPKKLCRQIVADGNALPLSCLEVTPRNLYEDNSHDFRPCQWRNLQRG